MFKGKKKPGKTGQEHTWAVWRHSYTFVAYKQCAAAHVHSSVSIIMVRKDFEKTKGTKKPVSSETGLYGLTVTTANAHPPDMNPRISRKRNQGTDTSAMNLSSLRRALPLPPHARSISGNAGVKTFRCKAAIRRCARILRPWGFPLKKFHRARHFPIVQVIANKGRIGFH